MPTAHKSKAGIGLGTVVSIGNGATPEVFTPVSELKSIVQSGRQVATEDVTSMESSAREFIPTLLDSGTWELTGSRIGTDAGQIAMEAAMNTLAMHNFVIQLPPEATQTTKGDAFAFSALVQEVNYNLAVDKARTFTARLKVSGSITVTAGS